MAGVQFAYAKATEGDRLIDPRFARNWDGMKTAGIVRGAYHFLLPNLDPGDQARHFLKVAHHEKGDLPPCLDVETFGIKTPPQMQKLISEWLKPVEQVIGRRCVIYCSRGQWDESVGEGFEGHPLWIAHYTTAPEPHLATHWTEWTFWQYSDRTHYDGVDAGADADRFNGNFDALRAFAEGA